ncbi:MAG: aminotransferase class III-fold pyridoxal phosphate-dependent enzyme, partial [Acidimicrobiia bacterium]
TGVGRTGYWFGYQHYDLEPDIVAIGKGIGNGYPVSVTAFSPQISADLEPSPFHYMQSHQNDPLGAAVVDEVIRIVTESDLVTKAADKGRVFAGQLQSLVDGTIITGFRGRGLMFAIDLRDQATGDQIFERLLERGYIIGNRDSLFRIDPPLTITEAEFTRFAEDFKAILS